MLPSYLANLVGHGGGSASGAAGRAIRAYEAYEDGEYGEAETLAKKALSQAGKEAGASAAARFLGNLVLALVYSAAEMDAEADRHFNSCSLDFPDDPLLLYSKAEFETRRWNFKEAAALLDRCSHPGELEADFAYLRATIMEFLQDFAKAEQLFAEAEKHDPDSYPRPFRISDADADAIVRRLLDTLPYDIRQELTNLVVEMVEVPNPAIDRQGGLDPFVCGYFFGYDSSLPAMTTGLGAQGIIRVFKRNLERYSSSAVEIEDMLRTTFYHEIGHALGFDEEGLDDMGLG